MKRNTNESLNRFNARLIRIENDNMIFDDGSVVSCKTINRNRPLRADLRAASDVNMPRVGATLTLFRNGKGNIYLDQATCYETRSQEASGLSESFISELKRSLFHSCEQEDEAAMGPKQWRVLAAVILSFVNAKAPGWKLYVGYDDNGNRTGLNNEVPDQKAEAEFEVAFKNYLYQVTNSRTFSMSVAFTWETHEDGLKTLTISAPEWNGDVLLVNGNALYVRDGASSVQLKHADMLEFIRNFKSNN